MEGILKCFKEIVFESSIYRSVPHKILKKKSPDTEHYNKEVKRFKAKVRTVHNKRKLGEQYQVELKSLLKNCWQPKKNCIGNIFAVSTTK